MTVDAPSIFLVLFAVSLGLTVLAFVSGASDLPLPGINLDSEPGLDAPDLNGPSVFSMPTILAFLTWFSGAAYLLSGLAGAPLFLTLGVAAIIACVGAGIVFLFLVRVVWPGQTPYLESDQFELVGQMGRLSVGVRAGGTGELVYSQGGVRRVVGARSERGTALDRGTEVVVVRYERGVAYVEAFEQLLKDHGSRAAAS